MFAPRSGYINFVEIGHEELSSAPSGHSLVSYWRKYAHYVLVNCLGSLSLPKISMNGSNLCFKTQNQIKKKQTKKNKQTNKQTKQNKNTLLFMSLTHDYDNV